MDFSTVEREVKEAEEVKEVRDAEGTPTPVFWQKRLQVAENKEREAEKERQERQRGCKLLKTRHEQMREKA
jgi:hypothetical protein